MNETLYRKYRPKTFDDVVGQEDVVLSLTQAITKQNISHSYIFAGGRGTGKTSTARILARALGTSQNDLYEIDAASNRGIDDIREIRDAVATLPYESTYKIYIIDEAHMLTKEAWNALLKTLEEPPVHVLFVFATTEVEKIPETILSRSQTFTFKKPTTTLLEKVILQTAKHEGFELEAEGVNLLALLADGSFRDAHNMLQKVISTLSNKTITLEAVESIGGVPKKQKINTLLQSIVTKDVSAIVQTIQELRRDNAEPKLLSSLLIEQLRLVLLLRIDKTLETKLRNEASKEQFEFLKSLELEKSTLSSDTLLTFLKTCSGIERSNDPFVLLELALLNLVCK